MGTRRQDRRLLLARTMRTLLLPLAVRPTLPLRNYLAPTKWLVTIIRSPLFPR